MLRATSADMGSGRLTRGTPTSTDRDLADSGTAQTWDQGLLNEPYLQAVAMNLGEAKAIDKMSWSQVDTKVLHVQTGGEEFVVKSAGPQNDHIGRELHRGHEVRTYDYPK